MLNTLVRPLTAPLILLLAAMLRFYRLSGPSLWSDEGNSVALAWRGFAEIAQRTALDIHPPLYYWLLKIWIAFFGHSELGLRSLSVGLSILLVYIIGVLGTRLFSARVGLIAAFLAALSPFQVYYAQEARMYMLLAFLTSLTVLLTFLLLQTHLPTLRHPFHFTPLSFLYIFVVVAGLYTHYAYPLILIVITLTFLLWLWQNLRLQKQPSTTSTLPQSAIRNPQSPISNLQSPIPNPQSPILHWLLLHLLPLLLYLPWLPIAWRQITTWPSERQMLPPLETLSEIAITLLLGLSWPFDFGLVIATGLGFSLIFPFWLMFKPLLRITNYQHLHSAQAQVLPITLLLLWLLLPILLTLLIFSPAFLKFLLVASPPLTLLLALTLDRLSFTPHPRHPTIYDLRFTIYDLRFTPYLLPATLLALLSALSTLSLYHYYTNPTYARDNYRGIVNFIKAVGRPQDAIILTAEGQQDVFNYYYEQPPALATPLYPLPQRRPLAEAVTLEALQQLATPSKTVYAVYWATQQADPNGLIEGWLNANLFKATDQWYGNVRLVSYAVPNTGAEVKLTPVDYRLGDHIRLTGYALPAVQLTPGQIGQIVLQWETDASVPQNYTAFVQILDPTNHLVGQRDAPPLTPTTAWSPGHSIRDAHGVFIEPGSPPGPHRLIVGLYNSQTGQRLPVLAGAAPMGDFVPLAEVEVVKPAKPLPLNAFTIQTPLNVAMFEVNLLGYDFYKLGHHSDPATPLHPGDPVHLVIYWTAVQPVYWLEDQLFIQVVSPTGQESFHSVTRQPAGPTYPIGEWPPGEIIRTQYDFFLSNIPPGTYRLAFTMTSRVSTQRVVALSAPFWVVE